MLSFIWKKHTCYSTILYSKGQVTIAELSSELGCDRSTMSKQMKSLVENGDIYVVERERVKYFYLTEKGIEKAMILQRTPDGENFVGFYNYAKKIDDFGIHLRGNEDIAVDWGITHTESEDITIFSLEWIAPSIPDENSRFWSSTHFLNVWSNQRALTLFNAIEKYIYKTWGVTYGSWGIINYGNPYQWFGVGAYNLVKALKSFKERYDKVKEIDEKFDPWKVEKFAIVYAIDGGFITIKGNNKIILDRNERARKGFRGLWLSACDIKLDLGFIPFNVNDFQELANIVNDINGSDTKFRQLHQVRPEDTIFDNIKLTIENEAEKEFCLDITGYIHGDYSDHKEESTDFSPHGIIGNVPEILKKGILIEDNDHEKHPLIETDKVMFSTRSSCFLNERYKCKLEIFDTHQVNAFKSDGVMIIELPISWVI